MTTQTLIEMEKNRTEARKQAQIANDGRRNLASRLAARKLCGKFNAKAFAVAGQKMMKQVGFSKPNFKIESKANFVAGPLFVGLMEKLGKIEAFNRPPAIQKLINSCESMNRWGMNSRWYNLINH